MPGLPGGVQSPLVSTIKEKAMQKHGLFFMVTSYGDI